MKGGKRSSDELAADEVLPRDNASQRQGAPRDSTGSAPNAAQVQKLNSVIACDTSSCRSSLHKLVKVPSSSHTKNELPSSVGDYSKVLFRSATCWTDTLEKAFQFP